MIKTKHIIIGGLIIVFFFVATILYYGQKVNDLKREIVRKEIQHIVDTDKEVSEALQEQLKVTDSLLLIERKKYDSLRTSYVKTKQAYEKIYNDYSHIVIERPEY